MHLHRVITILQPLQAIILHHLQVGIILGHQVHTSQHLQAARLHLHQALGILLLPPATILHPAVRIMHLLLVTIIHQPHQAILPPLLRHQIQPVQAAEHLKQIQQHLYTSILAQLQFKDLKLNRQWTGPPLHYLAQSIPMDISRPILIPFFGLIMMPTSTRTLAAKLPGQEPESLSQMLKSSQSIPFPKHQRLPWKISGAPYTTQIHISWLLSVLFLTHLLKILFNPKSTMLQEYLLLRYSLKEFQLLLQWMTIFQQLMDYLHLHNSLP
jgi:hypothetical protein